MHVRFRSSSFLFTIMDYPPSILFNLGKIAAKVIDEQTNLGVKLMCPKFAEGEFDVLPFYLLVVTREFDYEIQSLCGMCLCRFLKITPTTYFSSMNGH